MPLACWVLDSFSREVKLLGFESLAGKDKIHGAAELVSDFGSANGSFGPIIGGWDAFSLMKERIFGISTPEFTKKKLMKSSYRNFNKLKFRYEDIF
jgi:hypothetical protein